MQHPLSPQPSANAHPWGWETLTSSQSLAYLGVAAGCLLLIVWLVWRLRAVSAPMRRTDERRRDESGVATIEFVLVAPFLLGITLILVQTMLVFTGLFYVNYAAYAAARSAIVYIPADLAPDGPNTVTPSEGFEKYDRIRAAAAIAMMPVSGQENGEQGSVNELVNGLNRYFQAQGETPPRWVENLIPGRFNYAAAHTAVTLQTVAQQEDGSVLFEDVVNTTTFGPKDAIAVQVRHEFALTVPVASRLFELVGGGDDGANSGSYESQARGASGPPPPGTWTAIRARAVLTNEGIARSLPNPPRVPRVLYDDERYN